MNSKLFAPIALLLFFAIPTTAQDANQLFHQPTEAERQAARERAHAEMDEARANYENALKTLEKSQEELRGQTHRLDVSPEALQKAAARLDEQLETLELDEVGSAARRKATEEAVKQEMDRVEKRVKDDAVVSELQNVVKAREAQLARVRQLVQSGATTQAEFEAAAASVAEAKARLAERQQSAYGGVDAESLASLRRDLLNLSIGEEERHARMQYLKQQQQRLSDAMNHLTDIQERQYNAERARQLLERAQERVERQRMLNAEQPLRNGTERQ